MQDIIEGKYEFPEDCPPDARAICEQAKILHQVVSEDTLNVVISKDGSLPEVVAERKGGHTVINVCGTLWTSHDCSNR